MKTLSLSLLLAFFGFSVSSWAGVSEDFKRIENQRKGPFTLNYLQGTSSRVVVTDGDGSPSGQFLFQAAYRNDVAKSLVSQYQLYLANLFTTNYYELMGEYVYGNPFGSHPLNHQGLLEKGDYAIEKANTMVKNWVLEKYYVSRLPESKLAASFQIRGISGAEFEQTYAQYFFNFYLSSLEGKNEFYYLPAYLLLQSSPVGQSSQLDEARRLISVSYDYFVKRWGTKDSRVRDLYELRNAIHNQLSKAVIDLIDLYVKKHSFYRAEGHTYLFRIKKILQDYYDFKPDKILAMARKLNLSEVEQAARAADPSQPETLAQLSQAVAELKLGLIQSQSIPWSKKAEAFVLISSTAQYLNKEVGEMSQWHSSLSQTLVNLAFLEGFLIQDNWTYFLEEAKGSGSPKAMLTDLVMIASDTMDEAFRPAYSIWSQLSPKMERFKDDVMKSSVLNVISIWASRL